MKKILILLLLTLFPASLSFAQDWAVTIKASEVSDLKILQHLVKEFDDVKITSNGKFIYNQDNGYVTAICNSSQLGALRNSRFDIIKTQEYKYIQQTQQQTQQNTQNDNDVVIPYQFGWPRQSSIDWPWYNSSTTIADMDDNGTYEIFATHSFATTNPLLYGYKASGAFVIGFPYSIPFGSLQTSGSIEIPALGDIDGDGQMEVVHADENGQVYAHNFDGSMVTGFPFFTGSTSEHSTPALVDVNNDGKLEIIITSFDRNNDLNARLHLLSWSAGTVTEMPGFPIDYTKGSSSAPVAADVDNDGKTEIFFGTGYDAGSSYQGRLMCYTHDGVVKPGWPKLCGPYSVGGTPVLYDLNNDNKLDVVIRLKDINTSDINGIYAYNPDGTLLPNFPFTVPSGHPYAGVSIGDVDGDNEVEIAFGTVEAVSLGKIVCFNLDGSMLPGFPRGVFATWVDGNTAIADVTGDGIPEIIGGTNQGKMYAITALGDSAAGFPLSSEASFLNAFNSNPTMIDVDQDGDVELFAPCNDRKIYAWDTPGLWDPAPKKTWSTYKGNSRRDGKQTLDIPVGIYNTGSNIPDRFSLSQNYPNPFNPSTNIKFALAGNTFVRLSVYNLLGERVTQLVNEDLPAGEYSFNWNASALPSGVYFYKLETKSFTDIKKAILIK